MIYFCCYLCNNLKPNMTLTVNNFKNTCVKNLLEGKYTLISDTRENVHFCI